MPELKTFALKCPGCGAALKVGESVDSFACAYCGASVRVEHGEGIVSLRLLTDAISNVQRGTDRTASELALKRLQSEVAAIEAQRDAALKPLIEADEKENGVIGGALIVGVIAAIAFYAFFGWWSIPVITGGLFLWWKSFTPLSDKMKPIQRDAAAKLAPLKAQIAKHHAIVDS